MPRFVPIEEFIQLAKTATVVDVRAPAEFAQGHIPGAVSLPLFDDEQRAEIGTLYKQVSRSESLLRGLELVGPKMRPLAQAGLDLSDGKPLLIHCWRGGMRSRSLAWLIEQVDVQTIVLDGGYKFFRRWVLEFFKETLPLIVLSGLTGSGKTNQLAQLAAQNEQVVDLERLANHRGSAFGGIGQGGQPTNEQFENDLAMELNCLDTGRPIWVEDESRSIGGIRLPHHFFEQLRCAPAIFMKVDVAVRSELINRDYGDLDSTELRAAIERITRRLGGQNMKMATEYLENGQMTNCIEILLNYYDRLYLANKDKLPRDVFLDFPTDEPESVTTAHKLIEMAAGVVAN